MPWLRMAQSMRPKAAVAAVTRASPSSGGVEGLVDGAAVVGAAALGGEGFGLLGCAAVVEDDLCTGLAEEADGGGADSAEPPVMRATLPVSDMVTPGLGLFSI